MKRCLLVAAVLAVAAPALPDELSETTNAAAVAAQRRELRTPPGIYAFIARSADAWFSEQPFAPTIFADDLDAALRRCEPVFVVDTRDPAAYAAGHIPGAVNIPLATLFQPENLARLPTDGTRIVTMCVTGHTGSMAASVLAVMGYEAATVRFGWLGWAGGKTRFFSATQEAVQTVRGGVSEIYLPVATGAEPGAYCH